jgi:two-component system response regulator AtoC
MSVPSLLIADDDAVARDLLLEVLTREGYRVRAAGSGREALALAEQASIDLALVDLRMPDVDGLTVLEHLVALTPPPIVLILTAFATIDTAIEALRRGAHDYLSKPFRLEEIKLAIRRALEVQRLTRENLQYRRELRERFDPERLVGHSSEMVTIYKLVARTAALDTTVLLQGETGTGKELVARAIHYSGPRAHHPFVVIDCTAIPETLFETEVFGHERGAFTGAVGTRRGLLETAQGGTCFLDEISELSLPLQAKLLRVLQDRVLRRVGGNDAIPVDVRLIAATNRDLRKRVEDGAFREDLFYRLNAVTITMPPLRDRAMDVPLLAEHFARKYAAAAGKRADGFAGETMGLLQAYRWPGNVRELEHVIERAVALARASVLLPEDLPPEIRMEGARAPELPPRRMSLEELKRWYVSLVLEETGGNKVRASEILGIDRRTLYRILERDGGDDD